MLDTRRSELRRKHASLGYGELIAARAVTPRLHGREEMLSLWSALIPLLVILVQGGIYWLLARGWAGQRPMPSSLAALYRVFRVADLVLLLVGFIGWLVWRPDSIGLTVFVAAMWLFGVIEFLNYFVVRLVHPSSRWPSMVTQWRTPRLIQDLRSARNSRPVGSASDTREPRSSSRVDMAVSKSNSS